MTSNTSNTSNISNSGNISTQFDTAGGWFFPDRANDPFVWFSGSMPGSCFRAPPAPGSKTDPRLWTSYWWSWAVVTQFAKLNPTLTMPGPPTKLVTNSELKQLANYAQHQRGDALAEILAQNNETISWFCDLLAITPVSHPATHRVICGASLISTFVVIRFKNHYQRPRPVQLMPMLLPPVVPGHPAYPSGHATQSQLIVECLETVLASKTCASILTDAAQNLCDRIAKNREIAGLHYKSDSDDGKQLAKDISLKLIADSTGSKTVSAFHEAVTEAQNEWP